MFQTFSGNSRRPRQVNLSGQNANPFAASSWTPLATGTPQTVAHAQLERQQRQQGREKLNAAKRIQRTWRGHRVRRELADARRMSWDQITHGQTSFERSDETLAKQLKSLLAFFSSRRKEDLQRLIQLCEKIQAVDVVSYLRREDIQPLLLRFANVIIEVLRIPLTQCQDTLVEFVVAIIEQQHGIIPQVIWNYYDLFSKALSNLQSRRLSRALIFKAIKAPLGISIHQSHDVAITTYAAFGLKLLTTPELRSLLGSLEDFAGSVNMGLLSAALLRQSKLNSLHHLSSSNRLWLLAHFIALHRLQERGDQEPDFIRALSLQLLASSSEIVGRIDPADIENLPTDDIDDITTLTPPSLPPPIKDELLSLVNQDSIAELLAKFNADYTKPSADRNEDASLLASYAVTLLRMFPRRGDEIRMWLYLGSMTTSQGQQIPALRFFWQVMSSTNTFAVVQADSKSVLVLLKPQDHRKLEPNLLANTNRDREWRIILLFLELYTFVLRFTDDEEFFSASLTNLEPGALSGSRIRESALPLEDVQKLTLFLKNLAFTMYYHAGEISGSDRHTPNGGLGTYFSGYVSTSKIQSVDPVRTANSTASEPFAPFGGMTASYVRGIVGGVMRMLYERDSRRRFVPRGHWLMTSRFEMEGFIPAVVMEEERQHQDAEEGNDEDMEMDIDPGNWTSSGLVGMARPRRALHLESLRLQQEKAARKKVLAAVGPRLAVLQNMPFVIPFETRVQIFRQFVVQDQSRRRNGNVDPDVWRFAMMSRDVGHQSGRDALRRHHARIRRESVFEDAYEQFYDLGEGLKEPIQITFVDQFDAVEAGIDGGGVTKEFLISVTNEAFRAQDGLNLFVANDQNLLYPNPAALDERRELLKQAGILESSPEWRENIRDLLRHYEFLGRIVGKCLYEGILVDIGFAGFFLLKWAASGSSGSEPSYRANINDLRDLDESLYQGLLKLKNFPGRVEDLGLDFTILDTVSPLGEPTRTITRELMPDGSNLPVTNENRPLYVSYVARHRLQVQPYQQTQAFLRGLGDIIKPSWLSMFNQSELQTLIGGDSSEIDVEDLRRNTLYGGVYQIGDDGLEHPTVQIFWKVLKELDDAERRKLLKYVTSTPRAPLLGFSQLNPRFSIRDAGSDEERLPSTSTCVNLLKLPRYPTAKVLKAKLLYAINSGAGFDLS